MSGHGGGHHPPNSVPPEWVRRILGAFFAGCVILVVLDFVIHRHEYHPLDRIPAMYAIFGFLGLSGLILASKGLRRLVMRPEDYYSAEMYPPDEEDSYQEGEGDAH